MLSTIALRTVLPILGGLLFINAVAACQDVPIHVQVEIIPTTLPVLCTREQEALLWSHIEKVADKKVYDFQINSFVFGSIDVYETCPQTRRLESDRRDLQHFVINGGWSYEFGVACRLCNPDDGDSVKRTNLPSIAPSITPTMTPSPTRSSSFPTSAPSSGPPNGLSYEVSEEVDRLRTTLERQLARKLTQKVNKNPESCFRGSDSIVNVSVEWESDFVQALQCYYASQDGISLV